MLSVLICASTASGHFLATRSDKIFGKAFLHKCNAPNVGATPWTQDLIVHTLPEVRPIKPVRNLFDNAIRSNIITRFANGLHIQLHKTALMSGQG
jgi:hypothetical protein